MKTIVVVAVLLALCVAIDARVLHHRRATPKGWAKKHEASAEHKITFIVALKQRNLDVLDSEFWAISNPQSPRYQEFKTIEEILNIVAPPQADHDAVFNWLHAAGAHKITSMGDAIEATAPVRICEKLFTTKFYNFHHEDGRKIVRQWGAYSLPHHVSHLIDMVSGLSEFPVPHYKKHIVDAPQGTMAIVPQSVEDSYGTPTSFQVHNSSQGVIEFEEQYFAPADLQAFGQAVGIKINPVAAKDIVGFNDPTSPGDEAELDIQYIASVGKNVTSWFWIEAGTTWLYGFGTHFFSTASVPLVVSVSYGWSEADQCEEGIGAEECQQLGVDSQGYVERVNTEFQKIGLRGVSILVASGDSGANGRTDGDCTGPTLLPDYPAASPYVTSVGATQATKPVYGVKNPPPACVSDGYSCVSTSTETAVSYDQAMFASGGGFSNVAARPDYQTAAVTNYLTKSGVKLPPASYFNQTGRGYPDVAAYGSAVLIDDAGDGGLELVGGTSCSSPIFAGVAALLNDYSIQSSGKPLGFLNPLLYQMQAAQANTFTDVTVGDNICTEDGCASTCKGYYCAVGWDPVTGLGSPNYPNMLAYLKSQAAKRPRVEFN